MIKRRLPTPMEMEKKSHRKSIVAPANWLHNTFKLIHFCLVCFVMEFDNYRIALPVRKISCCTRFSRFLSLYWKSLIVVITPIALLPIIILHDIPVSSQSAHVTCVWPMWMTPSTFLARFSFSVDAIDTHFSHKNWFHFSNFVACTSYFWWPYSGVVKHFHYVCFDIVFLLLSIKYSVICIKLVQLKVDIVFFFPISFASYRNKTK